MILGYVRVSTAEQNEARQVEAIKKYGVDKTFTEKVSGKNMDRPELQAMIDFAREGDTILVHDFSRLARSTKDLLELIDRFNEKGVKLISLKENFDTSTATGKLMITMIAAINEFERANLLERQAEGIQIAKSQGKYKGRKAVNIPNFESYYLRWKNREVTKTSLAKELNVSRVTLDRLIKEYENEKVS